MKYQQFIGSFMDEPDVESPVESPVEPISEPQNFAFINVDPSQVVVESAPVAVVVPVETRAHIIANSSSEIGWEALRDYVVNGITNRWGLFPRNPVTEASIFKSFHGRWGDKAIRIAKVAVEQDGCVWAGAPLGVNRFTINSDPFFAQVIAENFDAN